MWVSSPLGACRELQEVGKRNLRVVAEGGERLHVEDVGLDGRRLQGMEAAAAIDWAACAQATSSGKFILLMLSSMDSPLAETSTASCYGLKA